MRKEVIGNATLYLGDCMEILPSLPLVDVVITDPPYGINTKSDGSGKLNPWADLCNSAFWYSEWFRRAKARLQPSGAMWSCLNWRSIVTFQKAAIDAAWPIESLMVWDKGGEVGPGGLRGLRPSYELVALWAMPDFSIKNRSLRDLQVFKWGAMKPSGHPAEKPVDLMRFLVNNSTVEGAVVLDPFLGSGTTGVAALETGRQFIGIEQDPAWFDIACQRLVNSLRQQPLFGT